MSLSRQSLPAYASESIITVYDGNLTGDGVWTYTYDVENCLITASGPGVDAIYTYDPLGRRHKKSGAGVADVTFLHDGPSTPPAASLRTG